ncbi:GH3 auxin-responsive promoter-domain-containing protein [Suillus lakei]|nr:GH3 auxin-responsive promoter-domain-containing protein [Suillus lakei]
MSRPDTDLLDSLSAEISQQLKDFVDQALLGFIRPNSASQFAQHAPELANFRETIAHSDSKDDIEFLRSFRESVPTTNYEPYRPYIAKFFATHCKESDVKNLFAPGLPYCLAVSSMTSGKSAKTFPTYRPAPHLLHHPLYLSLPHSEGSTLSPSSYVEDEWPLLVDCIEKGIIPDMENIDHVREPLEKHFTPHPFRAAELREIGPPGIQGWAVRVWPDLKKFIGITGGPAAASVPKVVHVLGPSVAMQSPCYGSSELPVDGVTEYLDWELVTGGHYEPVLTTRNGLWRYRIGDVVTVKGFAPDDGLPVINYLHRREVAVDDAIISASKRWMGQIIDFTIVDDDRDTPVTYGYLVEIGGKIGEDARMGTQQIFEDLMTNNEFRVAFWQGRARKPTIRLVEKGTFTEYRRQKCDKTYISMGQVKVPIVLSDTSFKEWLLQRVIMEL